MPAQAAGDERSTAFVGRPGIDLYVERAGEGPPLLFINGTGADLRVRPNGFDQPFAGSFDLVCYDQRGLGQSVAASDGDAGEGSGVRDSAAARDSGGPGWSMADYGDDAAAILDWAGWEAAAVMGVSFGGMVAQELLVRHPGRVTHAVLACTSTGGEGGSSYPLHTLGALPPDERVATQMRLMDTRWADPDFVDPLRAVVATWGNRPPPSQGALAQLEARRHHDTWDRLPQVSCPVLVCAGRYDGIAPLGNSEALAARIPGARLEVFEGGHGFMFQDPAAYERIAAFLRDPAA